MKEKRLSLDLSSIPGDEDLYFLRVYDFTSIIDGFGNQMKTGISNRTLQNIKVARYSFSRPIPPKFEHKLRRHKQSFAKIATTVVVDKV